MRAYTGRAQNKMYFIGPSQCSIARVLLSTRYLVPSNLLYGPLGLVYASRRLDSAHKMNHFLRIHSDAIITICNAIF